MPFAKKLIPLSLFLNVLAALGQQPIKAPTSGSPSLKLDVTVTDHAGKPVAGLLKQDFSVLDNKSASQIIDFRAVDNGPVKIILLIDAVNARFSTVAYEREQLKSFFLANGGHLSQPLALAVLTDSGTKIEPQFTQDGASLDAAFEHYEIGLRSIRRSEGIYGADERLQISLRALHQLTGYLSAIPGRKIVLWVSPGWPLLSGPRIDLSAKQQNGLFSEIVSSLTQMQAANVILYNINPVGPGEPLIRSTFYETFLKGVSKPSQAEIGDLGLQVLSVHSGGQALEPSNGIAEALQRCIDEEGSWYEVTIERPPAEVPNQLHRDEIRLDKPGLVAHTRDVFYAQP